MAAPFSCDYCEELLADYLLHALEPEAVNAVTEHLSTCERCSAQLVTYEAVLDQLAQAVPQIHVGTGQHGGEPADDGGHSTALAHHHPITPQRQHRRLGSTQMR